MKILVPCFGLLLLVFGLEPGSSDAFALPFLENRFDALDQGVNRWKCHDEPILCTSCFVLLAQNFCINITTIKPQGFGAVALRDNKPFLLDTVTGPGTTITAAGYQACWFTMMFENVDPKKRSGTAEVLYKCDGKQQDVFPGHFEINTKKEEDGMTFETGLKNAGDLFL